MEDEESVEPPPPPPSTHTTAFANLRRFTFVAFGALIVCAVGGGSLAIYYGVCCIVPKSG